MMKSHGDLIKSIRSMKSEIDMEERKIIEELQKSVNLVDNNELISRMQEGKRIIGELGEKEQDKQQKYQESLNIMRRYQEVAQRIAIFWDVI